MPFSRRHTAYKGNRQVWGRVTSFCTNSTRSCFISGKICAKSGQFGMRRDFLPKSLVFVNKNCPQNEEMYPMCQNYQIRWDLYEEIRSIFQIPWKIGVWAGITSFCGSTSRKWKIISSGNFSEKTFMKVCVCYQIWWYLWRQKRSYLVTLEDNLTVTYCHA